MSIPSISQQSQEPATTSTTTKPECRFWHSNCDATSDSEIKQRVYIEQADLAERCRLVKEAVLKDKASNMRDSPFFFQNSDADNNETAKPQTVPAMPFTYKARTQK